jgi:hypothetical protein
MRHRLLSLAGALTLFAAPLYAQAVGSLLPGTKPGVLSTIVGKAVNAANVPMGSMLIRLRDVRFGRVVATTITDKAGQFDFKAVDTGSYIAEMMSSSGDVVLASSSILYVGSGEILSTVLKVSSGRSGLGSLLTSGNTAVLAGASAAAIAGAAAASSTPAAQPAGEPATSQNPTHR